MLAIGGKGTFLPHDLVIISAS